MKEPPIQNNVELLWNPFRAKIEILLKRMNQRGFDPKPFETMRSLERQKWLYGYGRNHHIGLKPKTWTMNSRHIPGKAVDIVSKSRWWDWPEFFIALKVEAKKLGLKVLDVEQCHVEWRG